MRDNLTVNPFVIRMLSIRAAGTEPLQISRGIAPSVLSDFHSARIESRAELRGKCGPTIFQYFFTIIQSLLIHVVVEILFQ